MHKREHMVNLSMWINYMYIYIIYIYIILYILIYMYIHNIYIYIYYDDDCITHPKTSAIWGYHNPNIISVTLRS